MPEITILSTNRVRSTQPGRHAMYDRVVWFSVQGRGNDHIYLPDEDFTLEKAQAAITEHVRSIPKVEGHTFEV